MCNPPIVQSEGARGARKRTSRESRVSGISQTIFTFISSARVITRGTCRSISPEVRVVRVSDLRRRRQNDTSLGRVPKVSGTVSPRWRFAECELSAMRRAALVRPRRRNKPWLHNICAYAIYVHKMQIVGANLKLSEDLISYKFEKCEIYVVRSRWREQRYVEQSWNNKINISTIS